MQAPKIIAKTRTVALLVFSFLLLATGTSWAQITAIEGQVKGPDGGPLKGALVKIDRKDIKGHYQVKTDKKGHYYYGGLPLGTYKITVTDKSSYHNFTLEKETKPNIEKHISGTGFTGTKTITVKLVKGHWKYYCSVHEPQMYGWLWVR